MNYGGWAFSGKIDKSVQQAAEKVDYERDIENFVKIPLYARTAFEGKLRPGNKVTELDLLAWADSGNLCFGGYIEVNGLEFKGWYNTD